MPVRAVAPAHSPSSGSGNRFLSPGVDAGDYLYISGQGSRRADGTMPSTFDAQLRQALDNVKAVVESAGLTLENVVYVQVYLTNISSYSEMDRVFGAYFPKAAPARAVLGVYALPDPPIEINAVAVRNLEGRRVILHRRAFLLMTGFSFPAWPGLIPQLARFPTILQFKLIWRSTGCRLL